MSLRGPAGERGKTGDHGQHGDTGDEGARGHQGQQGVQGHTGNQGAQGKPGPQGIQGLRGRALTWTQALVMFLLIVLIGLVMAFTVERQQQRLATQQAALAVAQNRIEENSAKIAEERYLGCLGGVQIIKKFNDKTRSMIAVERRSNDPLAKERIKAYQKGLITLPDPACRR